MSEQNYMDKRTSLKTIVSNAGFRRLISATDVGTAPSIRAKCESSLLNGVRCRCEEYRSPPNNDCRRCAKWTWNGRSRVDGMSKSIRSRPPCLPSFRDLHLPDGWSVSLHVCTYVCHDVVKLTRTIPLRCHRHSGGGGGGGGAAAACTTRRQHTARRLMRLTTCMQYIENGNDRRNEIDGTICPLTLRA